MLDPVSFVISFSVTVCLIGEATKSVDAIYSQYESAGEYFIKRTLTFPRNRKSYIMKMGMNLLSVLCSAQLHELYCKCEEVSDSYPAFFLPIATTSNKNF